MKKKYLLVGDYITSKSDKDLHYISAPKLCDLYQLKPELCIFADFRRPENLKGYEGLIRLGPRYNGDYQEHLQEIQKITST